MSLQGKIPNYIQKMGVFALVLGLGCGPVQAAVDPISAPELDAAILAITPTCNDKPAEACIDAAWEIIDADGDGLISAEEFSAIQEGVQRWAQWRGDSLPPRTRTGVLLGLAVVQGIGTSQLIASYDADGDGVLSQEEALSDVNLDGRSLSEILKDPNGLDRQAMAAKLGPMGALLNGVYENQ